MDFLIDEIGVESYFFHYFLNVCVVQNRLLRLSKGLFREKYSNKNFIFEASFEYQSFKLTAELNLSREEFFLFSKLWKWSNNISKSLFIPYSIPKFETISLQSCLFLHFNDFQSSKSCLFRFGVRLPEICFKKTHQLRVIFSNLHQNQKSWLPTETSATFIWLHTTNSINLIKKRGNATFFKLYRQYFPIFIASNFFSFIFTIVFVKSKNWKIEKLKSVLQNFLTIFGTRNETYIDLYVKNGSS